MVHRTHLENCWQVALQAPLCIGALRNVTVWENGDAPLYSAPAIYQKLCRVLLQVSLYHQSGLKGEFMSL